MEDKKKPIFTATFGKGKIYLMKPPTSEERLNSLNKKKDSIREEILYLETLKILLPEDKVDEKENLNKQIIEWTNKEKEIDENIKNFEKIFEKKTDGRKKKTKKSTKKIKSKRKSNRKKYKKY